MPKTQFYTSALFVINRCIKSMPARPLFWLTVFFMLGISADRLFGESLPVRTHYFAFAALILIAAMAAALWFRGRNGGRKTEDGGRGRRSFTHSLFTIHLLTNFAIPALLFVIFGMWASKAAAPQFPQGLEPFLKVSRSYIAEVSASPEYYPDKIRIPLRLLRAITGDRQTPLDGGVLLSFPRKNPANPAPFSCRRRRQRRTGRAVPPPFFSPATGCSFGPLSSASAASEIRAASITCVIRPEKVSTPSVF